MAIVGPSGCGKSTLMRCLYRFAQPKTGQILIDGQDIELTRLQSLRQHMAVVPQVAFLLPPRVSVHRLVDCIPVR